MAVKDTKSYALWVAFAMCFVCSVLVTAAAIALRPVQQTAKLDDKRKNILRVVNMYQPGVDIDAAFKKITPKVVDLEAGTMVFARAGHTPLVYMPAARPGGGARTAEVLTPDGMVLGLRVHVWTALGLVLLGLALFAAAVTFGCTFSKPSMTPVSALPTAGNVPATVSSSPPTAMPRDHTRRRRRLRLPARVGVARP
mgnify:CR=1 FL=1